MRTLPLTPSRALEHLVEAFLDPEPLWTRTYVDRRTQAIFDTASRHYTQLDEPGWRFEPEHEAVLERLAAGDRALMAVPRMPVSMRDGLVGELLEALPPGAARADVAASREAVRARPHDFWRPGTLDAIAERCDAEVRERWSRRIREVATRAVTAWLVAEGLDLDGWTYWIFEEAPREVRALEVVAGSPNGPWDPDRILDFDGDPYPHEVYTLLVHGSLRWEVGVCWGVHAHVPFREALVWPGAGVAVIGGGGGVHFVDLGTGLRRHRLALPALFGGLELDEGLPGVRPETLYVLGWTDIVAVEPSLDVRWWARDVAVDGVVFSGADGGVLRFSVEMDPPGGWWSIEVEAATGRELSRRPAS